MRELNRIGTERASVAGRQEGVVSVGQMRDLGLSARMVQVRVARGELHRWHRGVYAAGHTRLSWRGRLWAAVLFADGVISHWAAAAVWDLVRASGPIDVTTMRTGRSVADV